MRREHSKRRLKQSAIFRQLLCGMSAALRAEPRLVLLGNGWSSRLLVRHARSSEDVFQGDGVPNY